MTGSLTNFNGEPNGEGPAPELRFIKRGDPEVLLGERGGALPAGNMDGSELLVAAFDVLELPAAFKGEPDFTSSINDLT